MGWGVEEGLTEDSFKLIGNQLKKSLKQGGMREQHLQSLGVAKYLHFIFGAKKILKG